MSKTAQVKGGEKGHARHGGLTGDYTPPSTGGSHFKPAAAAQTRPGSKAVVEVPQLSSNHAGHGKPGQGSRFHEQVSSDLTRRASKKKKRAGGKATPYSRYNTRYAEISSAGSRPQGAAFNWWPYCIYGGASVLVTLVWCVASIASGVAVPTIGIALLCVIVAAGLILATVLSVLTIKQENDLDNVDILSSSVWRTALMMVGAVVIWVLAAAVINL